MLFFFHSLNPQNSHYTKASAPLHRSALADLKNAIKRLGQLG